MQKEGRSRLAGSRRESMGEAPVWGLMFRFSSPAIIHMAVASSYSVVDAVFIGRLGPGALAAMGVSFPLVLSLVAIASGTAIGVTSRISRSLGADDQEDTDRTAATALILCFLIGAIAAAAGLPLLHPIIRALGAPEAVLPQARSYLSVVLSFNILTNLAIILPHLIRVDGNPLLASSVSISMALLNILLDPLFIFGWGPLPPLGIQGAAVATVIAQAIGSAASVAYIVSGRTAFRFNPEYFLPRLRIIGGIYRVGTASIVRSAGQFIVMGVINNTAAGFGLIPLAVVGVLVRIGRFVLMPILGLVQGILPLVGYNFGARKLDRVNAILRNAALAGSLWSVLCWSGIMLFPESFISVFGGGAAFVEEGARAARLYAMAFFTLALRTLPGLFFQGIGRGLPATILTALQNVVFLLIPVILLPRYLGVTGLWLAFPVSDVLSVLFGYIWMMKVFRGEGMNSMTKVARPGPGSRTSTARRPNAKNDPR